MASASGHGGEELPPTLPRKQHRSHTSLEAEPWALLSPVRLQHHHGDAFNDVFAEPTDCQAARCPVHQRYDPSLHQERFFSDQTPPPVPKKKFTRTLSVPVSTASPPRPRSPLKSHPQNLDNPLYMLAPPCDGYFQPYVQKEPPVHSLSLSQLTFDTPDEHLSQTLGGFDDHGDVSRGIEQHFLFFLRRVAQKMEDGILLRGEAAEGPFTSYRPEDFLLSEDGDPKRVGDGLYHGLHSPKFPGRILALKVQQEVNDNPTQRQLSHVNVKTVVARFTPGVRLKQSGVSAPSEPPEGGSTERPAEALTHGLTTVESLLQRGLTVMVERDLPQATLEDFVQESRRLRTSLCDRHLCVLLLQIFVATQHLHNNGSTVEVRPQEVFLVWPLGETKTSGWTEDEEEAESKGRIQMLWRTHGSPRVVLGPQSSSESSPHSLASFRSKMAALLRYCLDPEEPSACPDSGQGLHASSYRRGLLHLSSLLQSRSSGLQMEDVVVTVQMVLWGPRGPLVRHGDSAAASVRNWLTVKRGLLVMRLAERGVSGDQRGLDWEDGLCLRYLTSADPQTVVSVGGQLW